MPTPLFAELDFAGWTAMTVTCAAAIAAAIVSIINAIRTPHQVAAVEAKIDSVHEIVNSQRTEMVAEITALKEIVRNLVSERENVARGKTLMQTAEGAAKGVLHEAVDVAKKLKDQA